MDKVILMPTGWALWTKQGIVPILRGDLPPTFVLIVCPELYLKNGDISQVIWSQFQQTEINFLEQSSHGIVRQLLLCQFFNGAGEVTILDQKIWVYHQDGIAFQCSTENDPSVIHQYLARVGADFDPQIFSFNYPSILQISRCDPVFLINLIPQHRYGKVRVGIKVAGVLLYAMVVGGIILSSYTAAHHWQELRSISGETLSDTSRELAQLYQTYQDLRLTDEGQDKRHYDKFVTEWVGRVVVTTYSQDDHGEKWDFIFDPNHQSQINAVRDWLEVNIPQADLKEPEHPEDTYVVSCPRNE